VEGEVGLADAELVAVHHVEPSHRAPLELDLVLRSHVFQPEVAAGVHRELRVFLGDPLVIQHQVHLVGEAPDDELLLVDRDLDLRHARAPNTELGRQGGDVELAGFVFQMLWEGLPLPSRCATRSHRPHSLAALTLRQARP